MTGRVRPPSAAMCVAVLGLVVALGGTTYAAVVLPANSVGTAQLKRGAVTGIKVKDASLTGADIKLSTFKTVPSAAHATSADQATTAQSAATATLAATATHALTADTAGTAYSTHFETGIQLPATPTVVASLNVPAGSYVLSAKGQIDTQNSGEIIECDIVAGTDTDKSFGQGGATHQSQILTNSLVHVFPVAGTVDLTCTAFGGGTLSQVRLTAMTVAAIVNSP
jgi:hypothetical protein